MTGHVPSLLVGKAEPRTENPERQKYLKMWDDPDYRKHSPGEQCAHIFLQQFRPKQGTHVIDFGAGSGKGAMALAVFGGCKVTMLDFAPNCLDPEMQEALETQKEVFSFIEHDLEDEIPVVSRYGFCCDVMEHIPTTSVGKVLSNIMKSAQHVFFGICTVPDAFGERIGETLHMTVRPHEWWLAAIRKCDGIVQWDMQQGDYSMFYVTAWNDSMELVKRGAVNVDRDELLQNIRTNIRRNLQEVRPHARQDVPIMILGGGWSLTDAWPEIIEKRKAGMPLVTINGTYNQCIERGLAPSAQIVCDAREFNKRFLDPVIEGCRYLLASQCHPSLFECVPVERTWLWHACISNDFGDEIDKEYAKLGRSWYTTPGGSSAMLRAFPLLFMLGFRKFEVYGFDSCLGPENEHHAYEQKENDGAPVVQVSCGDRVFRCHPWMVSQAREYIGEVEHLLGDEIQMIVHGDGLIAHIIKHGAELKET